jgi:formylglycine-generating enzyme required for sulfatase activity
LNETRERLRPNNLRKVSFDVSGITFKMIICPKGTFTMGSDIKGDNNPKRLVSIDRSFLLGETEVTQEIFEKVMGLNPSRFKGKKYPNSNKRPVENVTWYDAVMFCNKLSERCKKNPYYNILNVEYGQKKESKNIKRAIVTTNPRSNGFRLPLEKEWEFSAKAGTNNKWAGTNDPNRLGEIAWFKDNSEKQTHPVKGKRPNEWGFYDMSGNVLEWCWDEYKKSSPFCVLRVGSWYNNEAQLHSAFRAFGLPSSQDSVLGFRISASLFN